MADNIFDIKDVFGRSAYIREYLENFGKTVEPDVRSYGLEWNGFIKELSENLSKLQIVDFCVSYNDFDKTIDSVWKLIGGYTLSIAQFFTEIDCEDASDDLVVFSIHSPEKELLVSADMTVCEICDILVELEPEWDVTGQPERISKRFERWDMRKAAERLAKQEDDERVVRKQPVRVGSIVKKILRILKLKRNED